jgi:hypothetical protein
MDFQARLSLLIIQMNVKKMAILKRNKGNRVSVKEDIKPNSGIYLDGIIDELFC